MREFIQDDINKIETLIGYLIYLNEKFISSEKEIIHGCIVEAGEWLDEIKRC